MSARLTIHFTIPWLIFSCQICSDLCQVCFLVTNCAIVFFYLCATKLNVNTVSQLQFSATNSICFSITLTIIKNCIPAPLKVPFGDCEVARVMSKNNLFKRKEKVVLVASNYHQSSYRYLVNIDKNFMMRRTQYIYYICVISH